MLGEPIHYIGTTIDYEYYIFYNEWHYKCLLIIIIFGMRFEK